MPTGKRRREEQKKALVSSAKSCKKLKAFFGAATRRSDSCQEAEEGDRDQSATQEVEECELDQPTSQEAEEGELDQPTSQEAEEGERTQTASYQEGDRSDQQAGAASTSSQDGDQLLDHQSTSQSSLSSLSLDLDDYARPTLTDTMKHKLLVEKWVPPCEYSFPPRKFGKQNLYCQASWLRQYPYLRYSPAKDGLYCIFCFLFRSDSQGMLIDAPLTDWRNFQKWIDAHILTKQHEIAERSAEDLMRIYNHAQSDIVSHLSAAYAARVERNTHIMLSIIHCIVFCGQQGIALRGHTSDTGNFQGLVEFRAETDKVLQQHLESAPCNAKYLSPDVQNDLVSACGYQIRKKLVTEIEEAKYFAILADETTDTSTCEQVSICIRFVDASGKLREEFLGFVQASSTTGCNLANLLLSSLQSWGLDPAYMRGQGYDGAANMCGKFNGVRSIIQQKYPRAVYVHCQAHAINLVVVHSCAVPSVRNMLGTAQKIAVHIGESAKRLAVFQDINAKEEDEMRGHHTLRMMSDTRWNTRADALTTLRTKFKSAIETLQALADDGDATANSLLCALTAFEFIVSLIVVEHFLGYTAELSTYLQKENCDLLKAVKHGQDMIETINQKRNDESFHQLYEKAKKLADSVEVSECMPRRSNKQIHRSNTPADTVEQYWCRTVFYPFLDHMLQELTDRLCNDSTYDLFLAQCLLPQHLDRLTPEAVHKICKVYTDMPHPDRFEQEVDRWKNLWARVPYTSYHLDNALIEAKSIFYPNINTVFRVLLTTPVTTATTERTFSCLRRLKTWLRSAMGQERLSKLALMHIHKNTVIDENEVLQHWAHSGSRRIYLAFNY